MIPLDVFRREMRMHPWHFWGMYSAAVPVTSSCGDVLGEDAWQMRDRLGRTDIERALAEAEQIVRSYAGYWPSVHWLTERVEFESRNLGTYRSFIDPKGLFRPVVTNEKNVIALGKRTQALIGSATVVLTDTNGDGLPDTFTATTSATTTVTDVAQLSVTTPSGAAGAAFDDERIWPVAITIDGTSHVVVSGPAWLLADRSKQENVPNYSGLDPLVVGDHALLTTVSVWRDYTKTDGTSTDNAQAVLRVENTPAGWCFNSGTDPAGITLAAGRAGIRSKRLGVITPAEAVWDAVAATWSFHPSIASGILPTTADLRLQCGLDDGSADTVVCRLAAALMTSAVCACDVANKEVSRWQEDLAETGGNEGYNLSPDDLGNPIGTRRGQIAAWRWIIANRVATATLA